MNITGNLKRLSSSDLAIRDIFELDQREFPLPWSYQDWKDLNWDHHYLFGWFIGPSPVGFVLVAHVAGDDTSHLLKICLKTDLRGSGVALEIWDRLLTMLKPMGIKSIFLEVEADNSRAISFYKKMQFEQLRVVRSFYSDGKDGVMMLLTL